MSIPVITSQDEAFDYSHGEPSGQVLTVLRALDVSVSPQLQNVPR